MAGKNKGGREIRKPKQAKKAKPAKEGTDTTRIERGTKTPHRGGDRP
jgi:hypothetical protein